MRRIMFKYNSEIKRNKKKRKEEVEQQIHGKDFRLRKKVDKYFAQQTIQQFTENWEGGKSFVVFKKNIYKVVKTPRRMMNEKWEDFFIQ